jgi:multicomponent Na+:H+ antiporter subunit G
MTDGFVAVLLVTGGIFMLLGAIGILRMPDLYMRIGASTKASTLGLICILVAVAVHFDETEVSVRAIAAVIFVFLTSPVAAHMLGRAAYVVGVPLWEHTIVDELRSQVNRRAAGQGEGLPFWPAAPSKAEES